jgi:hypothetical protein
VEYRGAPALFVYSSQRPNQIFLNKQLTGLVEATARLKHLGARTPLIQHLFFAFQPGAETGRDHLSFFKFY